MSQLKYYNPSTSQWEPAIVGAAGTDGGAVPAWTSAGTIQSVGITGTTSAPTIGTSTRNNVSYRQLGAKEWELVMALDSTTTGGAAGSGDYLFTLPNGLSFDTTKAWQPVYTSNVLTNSWNHLRYTIPSSTGTLTNNNTGSITINAMVYSATQYRILAPIIGSGIYCWSSTWYQLGSSPCGMSLTFRFTSA